MRNRQKGIDITKTKSMKSGNQFTKLHKSLVIGEEAMK